MDSKITTQYYVDNGTALRCPVCNTVRYWLYHKPHPENPTVLVSVLEPPLPKGRKKAICPKDGSELNRIE